MGATLTTGADLWSDLRAPSGSIGALQLISTDPPGIFAAGTADGALLLVSFGGEVLLEIDIGRAVRALCLAANGLLVVGTDRGIVALDLAPFKLHVRQMHGRAYMESDACRPKL